jgi:hypothetical protein
VIGLTYGLNAFWKERSRPEREAFFSIFYIFGMLIISFRWLPYCLYGRLSSEVRIYLNNRRIRYVSSRRKQHGSTVARWIDDISITFDEIESICCCDSIRDLCIRVSESYYRQNRDRGVPFKTTLWSRRHFVSVQFYTRPRIKYHSSGWATFCGFDFTLSRIFTADHFDTTSRTMKSMRSRRSTPVGTVKQSYANTSPRSSTRQNYVPSTQQRSSRTIITIGQRTFNR